MWKETVAPKNCILTSAPLNTFFHDKTLNHITKYRKSVRWWYTLCNFKSCCIWDISKNKSSHEFGYCDKNISLQNELPVHPFMSDMTMTWTHCSDIIKLKHTSYLVMVYLKRYFMYGMSHSIKTLLTAVTLTVHVYYNRI